MAGRRPFPPDALELLYQATDETPVSLIGGPTDNSPNTPVDENDKCENSEHSLANGNAANEGDTGNSACPDFVRLMGQWHFELRMIKSESDGYINLFRRERDSINDVAFFAEFLASASAVDTGSQRFKDAVQSVKSSLEGFQLRLQGLRSVLFTRLDEYVGRWNWLLDFSYAVEGCQRTPCLSSRCYRSRS